MRGMARDGMAMLFYNKRNDSMRNIKAADLVLDFDLYPRNSVDAHNVKHICDALAAGIDLPPVIIDKKSKRVVDGFHRVRANLRLYGEDATVTVVEKAYKNDAAIFIDAMRYNASHGAKLDQCDRTHCVLIAERLSIPAEAVAGALNMPVDKLSLLRMTRVATSTSGLSIPLKRTISKQFAGRRLNKRQVEANEKLSGMNQAFYVNQLIELLESNMIDTDDERLVDRLRHLSELLESIVAAA